MKRDPSNQGAAAPATASQPLLAIDDLTVEFVIGRGWTAVVEGVSLDVERGQTVAVVGESGSGKTVTALAVLGLVEARGGRVAAGSVRFDGQELTRCSPHWLRRVRGRRIGMIFQQPTRSLDPAFTVGEQIAETARRHLGLSRRQAWRRAVQMLDWVRIPEASRRVRDYPHQFSGGMCQRVMIAIAMVCEPDLLIADEPTTALDVTVQATILELLRDLQRETGISLLFISHDLGVVADIGHRVVVMYAGRVVERASVEALFLRPRHPYTEGLLGAVPTTAVSGPLLTIPGSVPSPGTAPTSCPFLDRCAYAVPGRCDTEPVALEGKDGHDVRCVRVDDLRLRGLAIP